MQIERKKVSSLVLEELIKMLKSGELPPNSKLPSEKDLTEKFGVSRVPLREALSVLEASGIIASHQGGGSWIKEVNLATMFDPLHFEIVEPQQVLDLLEMRIIIESEAALLAAERHKVSDADELLISLEAFGRVINDDQAVGYEADFAFHRVLVRAAYNPFLTQTMNNLSDLHLRALKFSLEKNLGWSTKRKEVYLEHVSIYEAIKNRDGKAAKQAVITHLSNVQSKLRKQLVIDAD